MRSIAGRSRGAKVVWSGDGNNVCASFLHAAGQFGFDLTFTGPATLDPAPAAVAFARGRGVRVEIERDPLRAVGGGRPGGHRHLDLDARRAERAGAAARPAAALPGERAR